MNGGVMGKSQQQQTKKPQADKRTIGRAVKPRRKQKNETVDEPEPVDAAVTNGELKTADSGERLRKAVEMEVSRRCRRIAKALVDKAAKGDMTGAKLLVELTGARTPREKPPKKRTGLTVAQQLAMDDPWKGPPYEGEDVGFGGHEPEI
ncbi:MAG: hypothetical protein ABR956_06275 [Terracidiphilus sp.]